MIISRMGTWLLMTLFCALFWSACIWSGYILIEWVMSLINHS